MIQLIARSKAFHSAISKTIVGIQEGNSLYSFDEISLFYHFLDADLSLEEEKAKDAKMVVSRQFDYLKTSKNDLYRQRTN